MPIVRIAAGSLLFCALGLSCNGAQPPPFCTISRATYAARYLRVSGTGACSELEGEVLGGQAYVPDPDKAGDFGSLAIQSEALGKRMMDGAAATPPMADANSTHKPYSYGGFVSRTPDSNNVCSVPKLSDAELQMDAFTSGMDMVPATQLRYRWSNVKAYVNAAQIGVLWGGNLEYTSGDCTAKYEVVAISPLVSCADKDGKADPHLCVAEPDPKSGFAGSGLSPDIEVKCDEALLLCVPADRFPSLKQKKQRASDGGADGP
jgi:hypothetical protein